MDFEEKIIPILTDVLGDPKRNYTSSGGWIEYNCPCCADELGHADDKYNFAVTVDGLYGHCWKCGYSNKLSNIIRRFGTPENLSDYKEELAEYKESRLFKLHGELNDNVDDIDSVEEISLPNGFKLVETETQSNNTQAVKYLEQRGVDGFLIKKYNIGYCGYGCDSFSHRIVIPSYDAFGDLNYWVARDYTGKSKLKLLNPKIDKKSIVFNEYFVNWYEPITLVEGPFDHIAVPNSIPLLGKSIDEDSMVYKTILAKAHAPINILLDDDAIDTAYKMYKFLNNTMPGNIRIIECPDGYDASDYHRDFGRKGIARLLKSAHKLNDFELTMINK